MERFTRRSGLGLLLILTFVLALGTAVQDFRFDASLSRDRATAQATEREIGTAEVTLANLRLAQAAYFAANPSGDAGVKRVADLSSQLDTTITNLRAASTTAAAVAHYDGAASALVELMALDQRARDDLRNDQRLLASDVIFVDANDVEQRLAGELSDLRAAESAAAEAHLAALTRMRFGMNAIALGLILVIAVYVSATPRETATAPAAVPSTTAQMFRDLPPAVKTPPAPVRAPPAPPAPPVVSLSEAAELCVDLARVIDERDIPALVERSAKVLDAKGVIIWIAERSGQILRPSLAHGYSDQVLARLGALEADADNVTSLSFRSMRVQAVNGTVMGTAGAIAIPLVTAAGCTGVMALEFRDSRPGTDVVSVAKIVAAQFAALIGTPAEVSDTRVAQA